MKKFSLVTAIAVCLVAHTVFSEENAAGKQGSTTEVTITKIETTESYNPAYCLGRGIANLGTAPLEIPRCMVYDNASIPIIGLIGGVVDGAFMTVFRVFGGVIDVVSLGFDNSGVYSNRFPDFIWESNWLPKKETIVIEKTVEKTDTAK